VYTDNDGDIGNDDGGGNDEGDGNDDGDGMWRLRSTAYDGGRAGRTSDVKAIAVAAEL